MEAGEKGRSMKHQSYTMKEFLLSSHLEQMEFLMLSRGALQTAYAKECWSNQFLKFLKTVVCLSRTLFLQTLECNESGNGRGEKEGKEVEEKGGKKGDTPPEKEKGSSSKGLGKKMSGDLSPRQIDAKVLNVLCGVLEEWERAKLLFHYGKRVTEASFVSSPLAIVKDKGSTKKKVPKSKAKLLKEAPEKTDKKVTLALEDVKKEPKEWTPCSNQVQRSQSVTSADIFRSLGEVCEAVGNYLLEGPKKTDGKETLKLKEETTSCNQQLQRTQPLELGDWTWMRQRVTVRPGSQGSA
ncbi:uncharacterized protein [Macrobrachium rosenbergii]|uniref:uncharacterized protein isoform X2 n=1 Tax=Macrobrachium rosenbergii TaxID=79674 RepID=UPI0034D5AC7F